MKTELVVVGKTTNKHIQACIDDYIERLGHYMSFGLTIIPELKNTKAMTAEQQKEREGELILQRLSTTDTLVLLDEKGTEFRSIEMAAWLQKNSCRHVGWFSLSAALTVSRQRCMTVPTKSYRCHASPSLIRW